MVTPPSCHRVRSVEQSLSEGAGEVGDMTEHPQSVQPAGLETTSNIAGQRETLGSLGTRSPRGFVGSIVLVSALPIAVLTQVLLGGGSSLTMHLALTVGCTIAKHLRAVFGQKAFHRVERGVADENRVMFRAACEYADGGRVWVETTLQVQDGKIFRQVDLVTRGTPADHPGKIGQRSPT